MRRWYSLSLTLALPCLVWAADPKPDEMVNNPPFANWSSFKPGTSITLKETVKLTDGSTVELAKSSKLVKKSADAVVVETTITQKGGGEAESSTTLSTFPAKVKMSEADSPDDVASVTEGKETVDVKGKKVETEWVEATSKQGNWTVTEKVWTAKDVPGGIVRETLTRKAGDAVVSDSLLEIVDIK